MSAADCGFTQDAVLGGRLVLCQPQRGHRVGHDAILLAAATAADAGAHAVDLGAGVGAAGLALARRVDGVAVTLVDIDAQLVRLAAENIARNGLAARARAVRLDVGAPARTFAAAGLGPSCADCVLMNPPFNTAPRPSPHRDRRTAHAASAETLPQWLHAAARLLKDRGALTLIWRADGLGELLGALAGRFGAVAVLPVHPKPALPAIRVLVRAVKASRAPLAVLPGLTLADNAGRPTPEADAVLREQRALPLALS